MNRFEGALAVIALVGFAMMIVGRIRHWLGRRPSPTGHLPPLNVRLLHLHLAEAEDRARFGNPHQSV